MARLSMVVAAWIATTAILSVPGLAFLASLVHFGQSPFAWGDVEGVCIACRVDHPIDGWHHSALYTFAGVSSLPAIVGLYVARFVDEWLETTQAARAALAEAKGGA